MLYKFKVFENKSRGYKLTRKEYDQILDENCKIYKFLRKNYKKSMYKLYRGQIDIGEFALRNPKQEPRRNSIEDTNVHLTLIDNLDSWKNFPSYSNSIIGITEDSETVTYGDCLYEIIPFDGNKIAFCPESNIWSSFEESNMDSWGLFINFAQEIFSLLKLDSNKWVEDGEDFKSRILKIDNFLEEVGKYYYIDDVLADHTTSAELIDDIAIRMGVRKNEIDGHVLYSYINDYIFNPNTYNFGYGIYNENYINNIQHILNDKPQQIWTDGPCLLRRIYTF